MASAPTSPQGIPLSPLDDQPSSRHHGVMKKIGELAALAAIIIAAVWALAHALFVTKEKHLETVGQQQVINTRIEQTLQQVNTSLQDTRGELQQANARLRKVSVKLRLE